jgi:hypothetical protein
MFWNKNKFEIGKFPYYYECPNCHHTDTKMEHDKISEEFLKEELGINSPLPIFFQCIYCEIGLIKPIGYQGKPSFVVQCDKDNDIFKNDIENIQFFGIFK